MQRLFLTEARSFCAFVLAFLIGPSGMAMAQSNSCSFKRGPVDIDACLVNGDGFSSAEGLIDVYFNEQFNDYFLALSEDNLGQDYILFSHIENGVGSMGLKRGDYRVPAMISFRLGAAPNTIEIVKRSTRYIADPANPLSRSLGANLSESIIAVAAIKARNREGSLFAIRLKDLIGDQQLEAISRSARGNKLDNEEFTPVIAALRNFKANTDFYVDYRFSSGRSAGVNASDAADPRKFTITMQHSIIAAPPPGYEPRLADRRIGYFNVLRDELTQRDWAREQDFIERWRLEKADPNAALSEPVKPIKFWIENTTPYHFRDAVAEGVLAWNAAFETAGFLNAIEVEVQPDDADWTAGDIEKNVIRWVLTPDDGTSGVGRRLAHPETGEIIAADIILNYQVFANATAFDARFVERDVPIESPETPMAMRELDYCGRANDVTHSIHLVNAMRPAQPIKKFIDDDFSKDALRDLVMHEVGHSLGLNHNFKASYWRSLAELKDADVTRGQIAASVMDYLPVNLARKDAPPVDNFMRRVGPYDEWAIEFGYRPSVDDPAIEEIRRKALLARSTEPALRFAIDRETPIAIFSAGSFDPRAQRRDLTNDPVAYAEDRFGFIEDAADDLVLKFKDDPDWRRLNASFSSFMRERRRLSLNLARYIGGIEVERTTPADAVAAGEAPFRALTRTEQRAVIRLLKQRVFASDSYDGERALVPMLETPRRDQIAPGPINFNDEVLSVQLNALFTIIEARRLKRLADSSTYGGDYDVASLMLDLNDAVIGRDLWLTGKPDQHRRTLQLIYASRLTQLARQPGAIGEAAHVAIAQLERQLLFPVFWAAPEIRAHRRRMVDALSAV